MEIKDIKELIAFDQKTMQDVVDIHDKKNEALKALAKEKEDIKKKTWDEVYEKVDATKKELDAKIASDALVNTKTFEDGETSQIVAYGSAVSLSDSLLESGSFANADYYLSVLNTLTERENVISIQSKTLGGQELGLNTAQVFTIGFIFMVVVPIMTLACGMYLWLKRRNA